jgi:hypothetical protein
LQLALNAPEVIRTLALLEPLVLDAKGQISDEGNATKKAQKPCDNRASYIERRRPILAALPEQCRI